MKQPFCLNVYGCSSASKGMNGYFGVFSQSFAGDNIFDHFVQLCKKNKKNTANLELLKKTNKKVIRFFFSL